MVDRDSFRDHVHDALAHLYDLPFLQRSPLVESLGLRQRDGGGGTALHRTLIEAIEQLKPPREVSPDAVAWKTYRSLLLRYARSLNASAAASELGLSTRQAQRVHYLALASISTLLWEGLGTMESASDVANVAALNGEAEDDRTLDDELAAVLAGDHGELESFPSIIRGALATIGPVLQQRHLVVDFTIDDALSQSIAPHDLTRQALVQLFLGMLDYAGPGTLAVVAGAESNGARLSVAVVPTDGIQPPIPGPGRMNVPKSGIEQSLERRVRVAERLLAAIGGQFTVSSVPHLQAEALLPLGIAPTVLTVEDNLQVVQLFRRYLKGSIYQLVHAHDADAAVMLASRDQPEIVTLDVMMPRRDGWELLQGLKVRPETQHIPVLICSVLRDRELALALGAADFLPKPVSQHALLSALNRHVPHQPKATPHPVPRPARRLH